MKFKGIVLNQSVLGSLGSFRKAFEIFHMFPSWA